MEKMRVPGAFFGSKTRGKLMCPDLRPAVGRLIVDNLEEFPRQAVNFFHLRAR
jgi:hypothetical protein